MINLDNVKAGASTQTLDQIFCDSIADGLDTTGWRNDDMQFYGSAKEIHEDMHSREAFISGPAGTGKSRAILEKLHKLALDYAGCRILIVRKTRASLTESALEIFERYVLGLDHPLVVNGPERRFRHRYLYPNGSEIITGGMDKPTRVMSTEYDYIYVMEAIELTEAEWESLSTRKRRGTIWSGEGDFENEEPMLGKIEGDTNPDAPSHWLKQRAERGQIKMYYGRHEDNPLYYDHSKKKWTKQGIAYIKDLESLTGVRYQRLRLGLWVGAEGMVWEDYKPDVHRIHRDKLIEKKICTESKDGELILDRRYVKRVMGSQDWGFRNAGVFAVWVEDNDGRLYLLYQIYRTRRLNAWWIKQVKKAHRKYNLDFVVCDPSRPDYIVEFEKAGIPAEPAFNKVNIGLDAVAERLAIQEDGEPRIYFYWGSMDENVDKWLEEKHLPVRIEGEIEGYVWADNVKREEPVKVNDHGCDNMRYVVVRADGKGEQEHTAGAW